MFPHYYPNRAVRRAVQHNKMSRLSAGWTAFLMVNPALFAAIKEGKKIK